MHLDKINGVFEQYYMDYKQDIYRIALWMLKDRTAAEDIVEDAFVKLYTHMLNTENMSHVRPWLILVVKRDSLNYIKASNNKTLPLNSEIHTSRQQINFDRIFINDMLENLYQHNTRWYQVIEMHYFLGMSISEISSEFKCSEYSVKNSLHKARKYLQKEYEFAETTTVIVIAWLHIYNIYYHMWQ